MDNRLNIRLLAIMVVLLGGPVEAGPAKNCVRVVAGQVDLTPEELPSFTMVLATELRKNGLCVVTQEDLRMIRDTERLPIEKKSEMQKAYDNTPREARWSLTRPKKGAVTLSLEAIDTTSKKQLLVESMVLGKGQSDIRAGLLDALPKLAQRVATKLKNEKQPKKEAPQGPTSPLPAGK